MSFGKKTPTPAPPSFKHRIARAAAPAYQPQQPKKAVQAKTPVLPAKPPVVQPKKIVAPAVYRPQSVPRVLQTKKVNAPRVTSRPSLAKTIQRQIARNSGVVQAKYAVGAYVTVLGEGGTPPWYGVVKKQTHAGYKVKLGGGNDSEEDWIDVEEEAVHPHPSFASRYEVQADGASVTTAGGTWTARKYKSIMGRVNPTVRGAHMELEFLPGAYVDATRIVLVQTVKSIKNRGTYYMNDTIEARSVGGVSIDQMQTSASPEYIANPQRSGGAFGSAPVDDEAGSHGYRVFCHNPERWHAMAARLKDRPHMSSIFEYSSQEFETTAIAAEGPDKGRYYGSVKWGWIWDGPGERVRLIPLQRVSFGSASSQFRDSAVRWNVTRTSTNVTPVQLPLPKI